MARVGAGRGRAVCGFLPSERGSVAAAESVVQACVGVVPRQRRTAALSAPSLSAPG